MTSVTLPSGPVHQGYTQVTEEMTNSKADFSASANKRCLSTPISESCKKRRKQSTPIRISAAEVESPEGKPLRNSPEPELQCPACQLYFDSIDQLQIHMVSYHSLVECKEEPSDDQTERVGTLQDFSFPRPEVHSDILPKDWMTRSPFNHPNPLFMQLPQFQQPENLQRQQIRIFNPDAYCDLCNKEFCNKYFLKTHKANKHGIYTDSPLPDTFNNSVSTPSHVSNIELPINSVPSVELPIIKSEPPLNIINPFSSVFSSSFNPKPMPRPSQQPNQQANANENESNESFYSNGLPLNCKNERAPSEEQIYNGEVSSPKIIQNESTSYKSDQDISYVPTSKMSPGQLGFNRDPDFANRLRKIGVMNPKAFCEICCKEYCNKYFLRTHKMKRHGLYIPEDRDMKMEGMPGSSWNQNVQTSPLNLMTTEPNSDRRTSSPLDIGCDICGLKFQNASLAQLHNFTVHSKFYSKENEEEEKNKKLTDTSASNTSEKSLRNEAISEDLQKLQTMILQLNELETGKLTTACNICNKDFENRQILYVHMITDHGVLMDEISDMEKPDTDSSSNNNTMCDICGKDVQNVDHLKRHMMEAHPEHTIAEKQDTDSNADKEMGSVSASGQLNDRRMSISLTPTSSYCDICNKELCNKYFMKTHMQRMHGIEIENGAQIGGVICDICNKELCSKYFLRVHKHNTHGIVEYGTSLLPPRKNEGETSSSLPPEVDPALKPADLADLSHRYFTHFTEVCSICGRRFRSTKWLKAHLLSDHGQAGAEKWSDIEQQQAAMLQSKPPIPKADSPTLKIPNGRQEPKSGIQNVLSQIFGVDDGNAKSYQCTMCNFSTTLLPLLFVHERTHGLQSSAIENSTFNPLICNQRLPQPELLQQNILKQQPFLSTPPPFFKAEVPPESEPPKEPSDEADDEVEKSSCSDVTKGAKQKFKPHKVRKLELYPEVKQSLKVVAKRTQMPATYALPQDFSEEELSNSNYHMQAFLMEETAAERHVAPAVVFLPVLQKQPAPISITFTLTPA